MSDGHYNRAILPPGGYQSALKVGKAMERQTCEKALQETLDECIQDNPELKTRILETFSNKIHPKQ